VPSVPGYPPERQSFDNIESFTATIGAGTTFVAVANFSGTPDSVRLAPLTGPIEFRLAFRGEAPGGPIRVDAANPLETNTRAQFVEARDPAGAGGQVVVVSGRYASRGIDVRQNRPGPSRERPYLPESAEARQVKTTE
jgi:hypothetical protein